MIRRGASFDISLLTFTVIPLTLSPCSSAAIARMVLMQVPSAVATRSVGENDSPLPLLSVGASVASFARDGPCTALQWRSPVYSMQTLTMFQYGERTPRGQFCFFGVLEIDRVD
jgi:hypothetical protein